MGKKFLWPMYLSARKETLRSLDLTRFLAGQELPGDPVQTPHDATFLSSA